MNKPLVATTSALLHWSVLLTAAFTLLAGCGGDKAPAPTTPVPQKEANTTQTDETPPTASPTPESTAPASEARNPKESANVSTSEPSADGPMAMLPKTVSRWFELSNPIGSAKRLGLIDAGDGFLDKMLAEDGKQIQEDLGIDIGNETALKATGIALDRPVGVAWMESKNPMNAVNAALPDVAAVVVYAHVASMENFEKTLKTLSDNTDYTLKTERVNAGQTIHQLDTFTCIAVHKDVAMAVFQKPQENDSPALPQSCKDALTRAPSDSFASVVEEKKLGQMTGDVRGYDHGELVGNTLHPVLWMFLQVQGMRQPSLAQVTQVFEKTVPETVHAQHRVTIGSNHITAASHSTARGERLMPSLFKNAKPPAWRGNFEKTPALVLEINLDFQVMHQWWKSICDILQLGTNTMLEMVEKSGLTGRLAVYGTVSEDAVKSGSDDPFQLHVFAEIKQPNTLGDTLKSLAPPIASAENNIWEFPGPTGRKIWVHLGAKSVLVTTDKAFINQTQKARPKPQWTLPSDTNGASLATRFDLGPLALAAAMWNEKPIKAPKVEAGWSKDPEVAKLVKELQALRDQEANDSRDWRKAERAAVAEFWTRLGTAHGAVTRSPTGVDMQVHWQTTVASWSEAIKESMSHADKMKKRSLDYRKAWHKGSLKREALMQEIQKRSKL